MGAPFLISMKGQLEMMRSDICYAFARQICCPYEVAPEQKARLTYDNILRLSDDPDVNNVIRFLREREIVHFQRFGEANHTDLSRIYPLWAAAHRGYCSRIH